MGFQKPLANAASCIGKGLFATSHFTWVETVDMISESKGCEEVQNPGIQDIGEIVAPMHEQS